MSEKSKTAKLVEERFSFDKAAYTRLEELQRILGLSDKAAVVREALSRLDAKIFGREKSLLAELFGRKTEPAEDQPVDDRPAESKSPSEPQASDRVFVAFKFDEEAHRRMEQLKERIKVPTFAEVVRRALVLLDTEVSAQR